MKENRKKVSNPIRIESLDDPRIAVYRNLKDRKLASDGGKFIAEGILLVQRLLQSDFPVDSVMSAARHFDTIAQIVPPDVPLYAASKDVVNDIVGFKFHSGVIACGIRKPNLSLGKLLPPDPGAKPITLVICPALFGHDNLGMIIRMCAGFGVDGMLIGPSCCDPFWRKCIRASMGAVFKLPICKSDDLQRDLSQLKDQWGFELVATVLDKDVEPLANANRASHLALLFGGEAQGLESEWVRMCDRKITIPMHPNTDSLNVATAASIFLYHFSSVAKVTRQVPRSSH